MSKRDDVNALYQKSLRIEKWCKLLFWANALLALSACFFTDKILEYLVVAQIVVAFIYVIAKLVDDGVFWYNAERAGRNNNIETAFGISLSEYKRDGYYNNELAPSIVKYAVNTFESNYFTCCVAKKMITNSSVKTLIAVTVLLVTLFLVGNREVLLVMSQAVFSVYVIEETVMMIIYATRMKKLFDEALSMLITVGISNERQEIWLLSYVVEYEAVKAHYKIRLDSRLFEKMNNELSIKWTDLYDNIRVNVI